MFLKRVKWKNTTYYYLMRWTHDGGQQEQLASLGQIEEAKPYKELDLVRDWVLALLSGGENSFQRAKAFKRTQVTSRLRDLGKTFDLEQCIMELVAIKKKYGRVSKSILETQARPNSEMSWCTTTIIKNLRKRGLSLKDLFRLVSQRQ